MRHVVTHDGVMTVVRGLQPEDEPAVLALFDECVDWFEFATGQPAGPGDVQSLYYALPAGCDPGQKLLLVAETDGCITAVVDVVLRYPTGSECWVGAFLVAPGSRGRGFGSALAEALVAEARADGLQTVWATVTEGWSSGIRFLESIGFHIGSTAGRSRGNRNLGAQERPVCAARIDLVSDAQAGAGPGPGQR